jgi:hypothetical protein
VDRNRKDKDPDWWGSLSGCFELCGHSMMLFLLITCYGLNIFRCLGYVVSGWLNVVKGSKTKKSYCQFRKNLIYDWLVDNPSQDLFGQKPQ